MGLLILLYHQLIQSTLIRPNELEMTQLCSGCWLHNALWYSNPASNSQVNETTLQAVYEFTNKFLDNTVLEEYILLIYGKEIKTPEKWRNGLPDNKRIHENQNMKPRDEEKEEN